MRVIPHFTECFCSEWSEKIFGCFDTAFIGYPCPNKKHEAARLDGGAEGPVRKLWTCSVGKWIRRCRHESVLGGAEEFSPVSQIIYIGFFILSRDTLKWGSPRVRRKWDSSL